MARANLVKHTCSCGHVHTISLQSVTITKQMVGAMIDVFKWCEEKGIHEFKRKEISHITLRHGSHVNSNWGYVSWLTGIFYHPDGKKGSWGIHRGRMIEFMHGIRKICVSATIDPTKPKGDPNRKKMIRYATINQIPNISELLDAEGDFIVKYERPAVIPEDALEIGESEPVKRHNYEEGLAVKALYNKVSYTGGGYEKGKKYDLILAKITFGGKVVILEPIFTEYKNLSDFSRDWLIEPRPESVGTKKS